jgi:hypothetical protein
MLNDDGCMDLQFEGMTESFDTFTTVFADIAMELC